MSQACPVSCRVSTPTEAVVDLTVLGTPVPVAHSTIRQRPNQRTFVLTNPNAIPTGLSPLEQSTVIVPDNCQAKETSSLPNPSANDSLGILDIRSMKGLSGNALDESLQAKPRQLSMAKGQGATYSIAGRASSSETNVPCSSVEEAEAETRLIQFDETELKCLEDAFSDLECAVSEIEATLPTKACATLPVKRLHNSRDKSGSHYDDSATTVSSLHSALDSGRTDKTAFDCVTNVTGTDHNSGQTSSSAMHEDPDVREASSESKALNNDEVIEQPYSETSRNQPPVNPSLQTLISALCAAQSVSPIDKKCLSLLPSQAGLSSILEKESRAESTHLSSRSHVSPEVINSTSHNTSLIQQSDNPLTTTATVTAEAVTAGDHHPPTSRRSLLPMSKNVVLGTTTSCQDQCIIPQASSNVSKFSLASFTSVTEASVSSRTKNSHWDSKSVSQLPLPVNHFATTTTSQLISATSKPVVAKTDAAIRTKSLEPSAPVDISIDECGDGAVEQSTTIVSCLHMSDVDGLLDFVEPDQSVSNQDPLVTEMRKSSGMPLPAQLDRQTVAHLRATRPRSNRMGPTRSVSTSDENAPPWLQGRQSAIDTASQAPSDERVRPLHGNLECRRILQEKPMPNASISAHPSSQATSDHQSETKLNSVNNHMISPLLSNTDCLFFAGALCGQIQYQDMLIKHHLEEPITVQLSIAPGGHVFKLVDELGYLLSGPQTVQLPRGLEYTVKIAYVARQPLAWDTGQLLLSIGEAKKSVWKVRLAGYSNTSQLECSCCKRLSAEVYWTTAVELKSPAHPSPVQLTPSGSHKVASPSNFGQLGRSMNNNESITSVVLTNFGSRAAWVWARAEPLLFDDNKSSAHGGRGTSARSDDAHSISILPSRVVIGPQHSQQITITLPFGMAACRVVFHYGDEVLRHQVRQHFILPRSTLSSVDANGTSGEHKARKQIRIADLMCGFINEATFPIAELPSHLKKPVRTEDWRRVLTQQLRLRQHLVLNVYACAGESVSPRNRDSLDQCTRTRQRSNSSNTPASIYVETEAFNSHAKSTGSSELGEEFSDRVAHTPSTSIQLTTTDEVIPRKLRAALNPTKLLTFSSCLPRETCNGYFSISIAEAVSWSSKYVCKVAWSASAVGDVRQRAANGTANSRSLSSCAVSDLIFECVGFKDMACVDQKSRSSTSGFGTLPLKIIETHEEPGVLRIPFVFRPREANTVYMQDWCISVWTQPSSMTGSHVTESRTTVGLSDRSTSKFVFPVTLQGRSRGSDLQSVSVPKEQGRPSTATTADSDVRRSTGGIFRANQPSTVHQGVTRFSRSGHSMELGPLRITGLPVHFKPVDNGSDSPFQTHELELMNRKYPGILFVKLNLPKAPFSVDKPQETRFRLLPNRCIPLILSYRPTEVGTHESSLGIEVTPLPSDKQTGQNCISDLYKANLPLSGVMS